MKKIQLWQRKAYKVKYGALFYAFLCFQYDVFSMMFSALCFQYGVFSMVVDFKSATAKPSLCHTAKPLSCYITKPSSCHNALFVI